jgi:hypothetical protein
MNTLPEHRKAYANDFGGESDARSRGNTVLSGENSKNFVNSMM